MQGRIRTKLSAFFFEYDTPRMVLVRNKKVGVIFRLIQLVVLIYVIGWVFLFEKGYQTTDGLISSVSVKLKGLAVTNISGLGLQVWDVADYVFPAQGASSFVVITNLIVTPRQVQGSCADNPDGGICQDDSGCPAGKPKRKGHGIRTGKCVDFNSTVKTCEILGWCPVEVDDHIPDPALLREAETFTLFIKNSISFPRFKVNRRNLVETVNKQYLRSCVYHKNRDPLCPIFELGTIVSYSGQNFSTLAVKGGVVGITIDWDCDLDWTVRHCKPVYEFHSLYNEENNLSPGFNFRFARYYVENGTPHRHLFKVFGIRFDILVDGQAGKFDIIPTMTTIGSGIGIFGVATVLCDLLLLHILPKRHYYQQKKFKYAEADAVQGPTRNNEDTSGSTMVLQESLKMP
ncbi:P2X purinoceptor 1 isoform X1 [Vombatus ursinus]|uniref:P2X purinoceptor n=1 Tax=Vombatus ursinus TaxID=29139 RepID=A0A4X2MDP1_VOMUR|nr:P2X purinoceptor 1 isoform X1 [Vombatus ursinus]XP_027704703.1 P2X purinoceptor 1 isoform X1 [Vombatus ursinus]